MHELDIIQILKQLRKSKIVKNIVLLKHQRKLIRYFNDHVISKDHEKHTETEANSQYKTMLASLNRVLSKEDITRIDKNILKGLVRRETYKHVIKPLIEAGAKSIEQTG